MGREKEEKKKFNIAYQAIWNVKHNTMYGFTTFNQYVVLFFLFKNY